MPFFVPRRVPAIPELRSLSLEEKIGQLLCLGWSEPDALLTVNAQAKNAVETLRAGALLIMGRNIQQKGVSGLTVDPPRVRALLTDLQARASIPLLLATDQEGGRVARFRTPFTRMPPAETVGATGNLSLAQDAAQVMARELAAVGINWNFAPDADIRSDRTNQEIGDRSFGRDPAQVAAMVSAQVQGFQKGGIVPCVKHFPGQGDTEIDSHHDLPTISGNVASLRNRELIPFARAAKDRAPSLMAAHILAPALDPSGLPASLSAPILTGLLRKTLGYDGLVVTDDLEMEPIAKGWGVGRAAVMAIKAGADMVLVAHTVPAQNAAYASLLSAARSGDLSAARLDEAVSRVLTVKRWGASRPPVPPLSEIGSPPHQAVARALVEKAMSAPRR